MIHALHIRLTLLYALLSALVLAVALGIGGAIEARALLASDEDSLFEAAESVAGRLSVQNRMEDSWLAGQEKAYSCLFYLDDNGVPLAHTRQNGVQALLTDELFARCASLEAAERESFVFSSPDGRSWRCAAVAAAPANLRQSARLVLALRDMTMLRGQLTDLAVKYIVLWAVGAMLLTFAGALLARIAIRPTAAAIRQQNEFVAAASHELRGPLTVIRSSLQAAEDEPCRRQKLLSIALGETERLRRLTEELLFLAGQDANVLHLHPEALEPDTFLLELWETWRAPAQQSGHELTLRLPDKPFSPVQADRARLEQLFGILLNNALEYAPDRTPVVLGVEARGKNVLFFVRDHGPGVSAADRQRIFRRFVRGEESRTGKEHFGLGLSIAHQIAELHGGKLWVEDAAGGGAVFILLLKH